MLPNDLLDLNLGQVQAVLCGYSDRFTDQICVAVWSGYYAAYYGNSKHAKKPSEVVKKIQSMNSKSHTKERDDTDMHFAMEQFAQRDLKFAFAQMGGNSNADGSKSERIV